MRRVAEGGEEVRGVAARKIERRNERSEKGGRDGWKEDDWEEWERELWEREWCKEAKDRDRKHERRLLQARRIQE